MLLALDQSFYQSKYGHGIKETQFNEFLSFRPGKTLRFFSNGGGGKHPKICFITANIFCSRTILLFNNVVFKHQQLHAIYKNDRKKRSEHGEDVNTRFIASEVLGNRHVVESLETRKSNNIFYSFDTYKIFRFPTRGILYM